MLDNRTQIDPETWRVQKNNKKILLNVTGKSSPGTISLCISHLSFGKIRAFKESEAWSKDNEVVLQILTEAWGQDRKKYGGI